MKFIELFHLLVWRVLSYIKILWVHIWNKLLLKSIWYVQYSTHLRVKRNLQEDIFSWSGSKHYKTNKWTTQQTFLKELNKEKQSNPEWRNSTMWMLCVGKLWVSQLMSPNSLQCRYLQCAYKFPRFWWKNPMHRLASM